MLHSLLVAICPPPSTRERASTTIKRGRGEERKKTKKGRWEKRKQLHEKFVAGYKRGPICHPIDRVGHLEEMMGTNGVVQRLLWQYRNTRRMTDTYITLNNGIKIPQIGFGCWKVNRETAAEQIYEAIKVGYRLFDGAMDYGNEKEVGDGIRRAIEEGLVKREELVVVSKLWNSFHAPANVEVAVSKVLADLKLDYLDVFYVHFPIAQKFVPIEEKYPPGFYCGPNGWEFENVPLSETWAAMEKLVDDGRVKSIGISNYNGALIQDLLRSCRIKPQLLQIEHHPYLVQPRLIKYAQDNNIAVTAYSSFGPQSFVELDSPKVKDVKSLFNHELIGSIAEAHNVSASKVLLRWATQRGLLIIPKSNKKERLIENFSINTFDLTKEEIEKISQLDIGFRFNDPWTWGAEIPIFI